MEKIEKEKETLIVTSRQDITNFNNKITNLATTAFNNTSFVKNAGNLNHLLLPIKIQNS